MVKNYFSFKCLQFTLIIFIILHFSHPTHAGKLDDFEKDATKKKEGVEKHTDDDDSAICFDLCFNTFLDMFSDMISYYSKEGSKLTKNYREKGKPLIPFFKINTSYQDVESDIDAFNFQIQIGYGPFGFQYRITHYDEEEPDDELDIEQFHLLGRMLISTILEIDFGVGELTLEGNNKNSGISFTTPILFYPKTFIGIEFKPVWASIHGNIINDYDLSLFYGWRYISFQMGYRWCETDNESLNGPYLGISFRY